MTEHHEETGHSYCTSPDGRETRNLVSGTFANRVAREKDGELVEMCAKEDLVTQFLQNVISEQLRDQVACSHDRLRREREELEMKKRYLQERIQLLLEKLQGMNALLAEKPIMVKRTEVVKKLVEHYRERNRGLAEENERAVREVSAWVKEVEEKKALLNDMNATVALSGAALLRGKNQEVHVTMKTKR
jgi:Skp family chaperone for outer membrane proteins